MIPRVPGMIFFKNRLIADLRRVIEMSISWYLEASINLTQEERTKGLLFSNVAFDNPTGGVDINMAFMSSNVEIVRDDEIFRRLPPPAFIRLLAAYSAKHNGNSRVEPLIIVISSHKYTLLERWSNYYMIIPVIVYFTPDEEGRNVRYIFHMNSDDWIIAPNIMCI